MFSPIDEKYMKLCFELVQYVAAAGNIGWDASISAIEMANLITKLYDFKPCN
ncbi:MAG: hypothetical protein Q8S39_00840 [Ignavibacteria bacterium]|nr:hypothetical protein [Ignavibacteria bacterium]